MKIIAATGNEGKLEEIKDILQSWDAEIVTMKEAGVSAEPEENGATFRENALIKAKAVAEKAAESGEWKDAIVIADDSGLVIDALNGEPGIYSARYMGRDTSYREKNRNLLKRMEGVEVEKRSARFVCAVAAICPDFASSGEDAFACKPDAMVSVMELQDGASGEDGISACGHATILVAEGIMEGRIGYEERGENGFGYDPIFYLPEYGCTSAELTPQQKNSISHRGKAFRAMGKKLGER